MGLLDRWRKHAEPPQPVTLPGGQRVDAVGEASYQDALAHVCGGKCESGHDLPVVATLELEPTNKFDPNAVMVRVKGMRVGYLCRRDAVAYGPVLRQTSGGAMVNARIVGGWDRGLGDEGWFGIWLDLAPPVDCLSPACEADND